MAAVRLDRIPEPELMDAPDQARAYSEGDFAEPHQRFVDLALERLPALATVDGTMVDLGCGPADVTVRVARACPAARVVGIDAGANMLGLARARGRAAGLDERIRFERVRLPDPGWVARAKVQHPAGFAAAVSNSLLHHLRDPAVLWATIADAVAPGAPIAVMDLLRPDDTERLETLVRAHTEGAPAVLVHDFRASLVAAYRPDEVRAQLGAAGLVLAVEAVSDRHLLVTGRR